MGFLLACGSHTLPSNCDSVHGVMCMCCYADAVVLADACGSSATSLITYRVLSLDFDSTPHNSTHPCLLPPLNVHLSIGRWCYVGIHIVLGQPNNPVPKINWCK
jgi:hypothetical protein